MKTLLVLFSALCLISTSAKAQATENKAPEKEKIKIEKKNVVLIRKAPVRLKKNQTVAPVNTSIKTSTAKKQVAIEPKK